MPTQNIIAIFTVLITAISVWAVFRIRKLKARHTASTKFRSIVLNAFAGIYPLPAEWPANDDIDTILRKNFSKLQAAVAEFHPFIPRYRRKPFDAAWSRYRNAYGREIDYQCYHHYMAFSGNPDPRGEFRRNVDKLLSFAKYH